MQIKHNTKLAIIAGSGDLVLSCVKNCHKNNINVYLIGIDGFYDNKNYSSIRSMLYQKLVNQMMENIDKSPAPKRLA